MAAHQGLVAGGTDEAGRVPVSLDPEPGRDDGHLPAHHPLQALLAERGWLNHAVVRTVFGDLAGRDQGLENQWSDSTLAHSSGSLEI